MLYLFAYDSNREKAYSGLAVPRWTNDSEYLVFHYWQDCSVAHLASIKRDGSDFVREDINGRNYGKTSPDICEY